MAEVTLRGWPVGLARRRSSVRAAVSEREHALARAPLFSSLSKRQQHAIARVTGVWTYPEKTIIVEEGKPSGSFYVILEGRASVRRSSRTVGHLSAGEFFGEISLLDPGPRTASVIAETSVKCVELAGKDFLDVLASENAIAVSMLRVLASRLRKTERPLVG